MVEETKDKSWSKSFDKCPGCGSTERFFEGILKELKDRGLLDQKINCYDFQKQQGVGLPSEKIAALPIGSELPAFERVWDICCRCGLMYSTLLSRTIAKKGLEPVQFNPNRGQRRAGLHGGQGFQLPHLNNPLLS